jgi:hypothetical protein
MTSDDGRLRRALEQGLPRRRVVAVKIRCCCRQKLPGCVLVEVRRETTSWLAYIRRSRTRQLPARFSTSAAAKRSSSGEPKVTVTYNVKIVTPAPRW